MHVCCIPLSNPQLHHTPYSTPLYSATPSIPPHPTRSINPPFHPQYGKRTFPGMSESQRDPFFNLVHSLVQTSIRADNYLKGSIVWFWDPFYFYHNDGVSKTPGQSLPPTAAVVQPNDTTYALLKTHAAEIEGTTGTWRGQACDAHLLGEVYPLYQGPRGGLQEPAAAPGVVQVAG